MVSVTSDGLYIEAMWLKLQHANPDDYVITTGKAHYKCDFIELAFAAAASTGGDMSRSIAATSG